MLDQLVGRQPVLPSLLSLSDEEDDDEVAQPTPSTSSTTTSLLFPSQTIVQHALPTPLGQSRPSARQRSPMVDTDGDEKFTEFAKIRLQVQQGPGTSPAATRGVSASGRSSASATSPPGAAAAMSSGGVTPSRAATPPVPAGTTPTAAPTAATPPAPAAVTPTRMPAAPGTPRAAAATPTEATAPAVAVTPSRAAPSAPATTGAAATTPTAAALGAPTAGPSTASVRAGTPTSSRASVPSEEAAVPRAGGLPPDVDELPDDGDHGDLGGPEDGLEPGPHQGEARQRRGRKKEEDLRFPTRFSPRATRGQRKKDANTYYY